MAPKGTNMETKHTPGPWTANYNRPFSVVEIRGPKHREDGSSLLIAEVAPINDRDGNAHLIAAAPDMLEALKQIDDFWSESPSGPGMNRQRQDRFMALRLQLSAAIAKAEGKE